VESTRTDVAPAIAGIGEAELGAFVREHYPRLIRLAGLICREPSDAADAVQVALEQAWRRRDTLREPAALKGWLDRIVVREAVRASRPRGLGAMSLFAGPREIAIDPADPRARHEDDTAMRIAFDGLNADQRAALVLHLYAGYTVEQTARIVDAPVETVRARIRRGKERLRTLLGDGR
jgi:RNA polymerase sigma-70 factor (ECF subfamily)